MMTCGSWNLHAIYELVLWSLSLCSLDKNEHTIKTYVYKAEIFHFASSRLSAPACDVWWLSMTHFHLPCSLKLLSYTLTFTKNIIRFTGRLCPHTVPVKVVFFPSFLPVSSKCP